MCLYHRGERLQHEASTPSVCHLHVSWQFGEMFAAFALLSGAQAEAGRQPRLSHCCRLHLITWTPLIESCPGPYCIILLHCRWIKKVNCVCMCVWGCTGVILCVYKRRWRSEFSCSAVWLNSRWKLDLRRGYGEALGHSDVLGRRAGTAGNAYVQSSCY